MAYNAGENTRVRIVPPKIPPINVYASVPQKTDCEWNERQHGGERGQNDRTGALHGGLDDGVERRQSILLVAADLTDQDERVAHQDSGKRDQTDQPAS
jgi:hypothetical protein